jgi:hypothetical protein
MEDQGMKKKAKPAAKPKGMTSDDHRKLADKHRVKSRMHEVKADMLDIDNPPPKSDKNRIRPY